MQENTTPTQPSEAKQFLEVVEALNDAITNSSVEAQYYCEQYLQTKFGLNPYTAPAETPAAPTDQAAAAAGQTQTDPNAQPADPNAQASA